MLGAGELNNQATKEPSFRSSIKRSRLDVDQSVLSNSGLGFGKKCGAALQGSPLNLNRNCRMPCDMYKCNLPLPCRLVFGMLASILLSASGMSSADFQGATHIMPFDEDTINYSKTSATGPINVCRSGSIKVK